MQKNGFSLEEAAAATGTCQPFRCAAVVGDHRPVLDCAVVRDAACRLFGRARFAVIETDYFGGHGDQAAIVYENGSVIMTAEVAEVGPINRALRLLGVQVGNARDEFEALALNRFRGWDE